MRVKDALIPALDYLPKMGFLKMLAKEDAPQCSFTRFILFNKHSVPMQDFLQCLR